MMRIDLNAPVTLSSVRAALREFSLWWWGEIWSLFPARVRGWIGHAFEHWTLEISQGAWKLYRRDRRSGEIVLDPQKSGTELAGEIAALLRTGFSGRVEALLPAQDVLIRRIRVPAVAASHLRSVVRLQIDRLFPFRSQDVQFDCRKTQPAADGEIEAEVAVIPKAALRQYQARLCELGLRAGRFAVEGSTLGFRSGEWRLTTQERTQLILVAVAVLLWAAACFLAPVMREAELDRISGEIAALRPAAQEATQLREELRRLQEPVSVASKMLAQPGPLDMLRLVAERTPEKMQLREMTIDGATVHMQGEAADVIPLVSGLRNAGDFSVVRQMSTAAGPDAFDIELKLRGRQGRGAQR